MSVQLRLRSPGPAGALPVPTQPNSLESDLTRFTGGQSFRTVRGQPGNRIQVSSEGMIQRKQFCIRLTNKGIEEEERTEQEPGSD